MISLTNIQLIFYKFHSKYVTTYKNLKLVIYLLIKQIKIKKCQHKKITKFYVNSFNQINNKKKDCV